MKNEIIAYVGSGEFTAEDAAKLTAINFAFGHLHNDGTVTCEGVCREKLEMVPQMRTWNPKLRFLLSIVQADRDAFTRCCADPELRVKAAASLAEVAKKYTLDGIDLDWEYPCVPSNNSAVSPDDKHNFTLFCAELRKQLDALGGRRWLTIAAGADVYYVNCIELPELMDSLDYINVMTYDLKCGFHALAGHHTSLFSKTGDVFMNSCAQALALFEAKGVPADRLLMGAAFYSRKWENLNNNENHGLLEICKTGGGYGPDYTDLKADYINKNGYTEYWDEESAAPYLFNGSTFLSYDNPRSLRAKAAYTKEKGYAGIFYWEHKCDATRELLDTLVDAMKE